MGRPRTPGQGHPRLRHRCLRALHPDGRDHLLHRPPDLPQRAPVGRAAPGIRQCRPHPERAPLADHRRDPTHRIGRHPAGISLRAAHRRPVVRHRDLGRAERDPGRGAEVGPLRHAGLPALLPRGDAAAGDRGAAARRPLDLLRGLLARGAGRHLAGPGLRPRCSRSRDHPRRRRRGSLGQLPCAPAPRRRDRCGGGDRRRPARHAGRGRRRRGSPGAGFRVQPDDGQSPGQDRARSRASPRT